MYGLETEKEIVKIGNSSAVIIPSNMMQTCQLKPGDKIKLRAETNGNINLSRIEKVKPMNLCGIIKGGPKAAYKDFRDVRKLLERGFEKRMKRFYK